MKMTYALRLAACALALAATCHTAYAVDVNISMNVFPTNIGNPNGGGAWTIVAKTNSTQAIAAISAYLNNVNVVGLDVENDIGHDFADPLFAVQGSVINLVYGQNTTIAPLVGGVGTLSKSDGPDPLGNPAWNDATRIFSGTYSSTVPTFATNVGSANNNTDANTFAQVMVGLGTLNADTTTVVRVAVPEPAAALALFGVIGTAALVRRRR